MKETDNLILFSDDYMSQWYPAHFSINGEVYNCAEQYMMAEKARLMGDRERLRQILRARSPRVQKALGRSVRPFHEPKWHSVCRDVVFRGNLAKFSQNAKLKQHLLETGNKVLAEASPRDRIWGIGLAADDPRALRRMAWRGANWLGEALMRVRRELRASA